MYFRCTIHVPIVHNIFDFVFYIATCFKTFSPENTYTSKFSTLFQDNTSSSSKITPNIISTTATTKTTTTNTKGISTTSKKTKPIPRFAYHRVPGSFASFRVIRPAVYPVATMPSFDSFHDDEPPRSEGAQQTVI